MLYPVIGAVNWPAAGRRQAAFAKDRAITSSERRFIAVHRDLEVARVHSIVRR
jgi:hypothetical protein